ncbi:MAG TPA: extracellular solute-binding protein [Spirochaetia bacterium]|nr:extracellular solute-binding protein [Spirochaetia bacterium]
MRRLVVVLVALGLVAGLAFAQTAQPPKSTVRIAFWTQEGESEGAFQFAKKLADAFTAKYPNITFDLLNKETEALRQDFLAASLANSAPDLLLTVNDHAGPFTVADVIQPVDKLFDMKQYVPSIVMGGKTWGVPVSSGNHLMLLYNKDLVKTPPKTTNDLIAVGKTLTTGDRYAIVWNQSEPFWMVPWLGGFGGAVFAADGHTPTLNTPAMVNTLQFLYDLKVKYAITPKEADYATADTLFKEGKAAMLINGDWSLGDYKKALGDKLGVAPLPQVSSTGMWPAPYTSGKYFMIPKADSGDTLQAVVAFIQFYTSYDNQIDLVKSLTRLPGLRTALNSEAVKSDPILQGSALQMSLGTPMPSVVEMRANWDSMKPEMNAVLAGTKSPADAAKAMQDAAVAAIKAMQ